MMSQASDIQESSILVVDDTPENLLFLSTALTTCGYEVRSECSGSTALSSARSNPPDLILLDIRMPGMDGFEVCQTLKSDIKTNNIPIVFLTGLDSSSDKVKAFDSGGVDYITKPFQLDEVFARVKNQLVISSLRKQLINQNAELFRSNQDLEQFARIISHDLKQPLHGIIGLIQILGMRMQDSLSSEELEITRQIDTIASNMNALIGDLLTYSRIGVETQSLKSTDCNEVMQQVLEDLEFDIKRQGANVSYENLPTVMADRGQLYELFQNLIANAIKFHKAGSSPRVHISVERGDREWQLEVRDNGIGIEKEEFKRIFQAFERGSSSQAYSGTGIGLATCKKVVERHGGEIWVRSEPGIGTSFFFTLQVAEEGFAS